MQIVIMLNVTMVIDQPIRIVVRLFEISTNKEKMNTSLCLVRYELTKDECIHKDEEFCEELDENAICNRDTNRCLCGPSYYLEGAKCGRYSSLICFLFLINFFRLI
jgi:hypothetical protein